MQTNYKYSEEKLKKKLLLGVFIYLLVIVFLIILFRINHSLYAIMSFLILFAYLIIYIGLIKIYKYIFSLHGILLTILTFVRYCVIPILIILDKGYMNYIPLGKYQPNGKFFYYGAWLYLWELVIVGLFLLKMLPKWQNYYKIKSNIGFKNNNFVIILFIMLYIFIIALNPSVLDNYIFIINMFQQRNIIYKSEFINVNGNTLYQLSYMATRGLKILIPIPFLCHFHKKYLKTNNNIYFWFSIFVLIIPYALIMEGSSRNTIIIPAISMMIILMFLFEEKRRGIAIGISMIIINLGILSILWKSLINIKYLSQKTLSYWVSYLEMYFAGISNMGKAVAAKLEYGKIFQIDLIFNDLFKNVPFFSSIVNTHNTSSHYFLEVWGRSDQVIPSTGNGIFFFGFILSPLVPIFIIFFGAYFIRKAYLTTNIPELVVYIYSGTVITYNSFNSISSFMMKFTIFILPLIIITKINKHICFRRNLNG